MKRPAYDKEALRENKGGMQVGQPSADPQQTQETTRTQITPDDISDDGPIAPASANGIPSRQQIEQDVVAVNPLGRQHGEPGLSPEAGQRRRDSPDTDHRPDVAGHNKNTHRKSGVFQFPADGQVSEIAPRVPPKAGAAVIGTSELFQ